MPLQESPPSYLALKKQQAVRRTIMLLHALQHNVQSIAKCLRLPISWVEKEIRARPEAPLLRMSYLQYLSMKALEKYLHGKTPNPASTELLRYAKVIEKLHEPNTHTLYTLDTYESLIDAFIQCIEQKTPSLKKKWFFALQCMLQVMSQTQSMEHERPLA